MKFKKQTFELHMRTIQLGYNILIDNAKYAEREREREREKSDTNICAICGCRLYFFSSVVSVWNIIINMHAWNIFTSIHHQQQQRPLSKLNNNNNNKNKHVIIMIS